MSDPSDRRRAFRAGDRVLVTGGYDLDPAWLKGGEGYTGTIIEVLGNWALVELDEELIVDGRYKDFGSGGRKATKKVRNPSGRWLALCHGWGGQKWSEPIGRLHVGLCREEPDLRRIPPGGGAGAWVESHAALKHLDSQED